MKIDLTLRTYNVALSDVDGIFKVKAHRYNIVDGVVEFIIDTADDCFLVIAFNLSRVIYIESENLKGNITYAE